MGAGGVIVPPPGYHQRTWEICKKYDVLYVSDEVVTAFGRLGQWFASKDVFGIEPDIIVSAKGISSGYVPLGAVHLQRPHLRGDLDRPIRTAGSPTASPIPAIRSPARRV